MEVTFYGTYDKKMFLEALKLTEKKSIFNMIFRYFALGLSILIIGGTLYAWVMEGTEQLEVSRVVRNLVTASLIGYYYFSGMITRSRSLASLFRSGPTRTMHGNVNLEGVTIGTTQQNTTIPWTQFVSKGEKGSLVALMTVDGSVAVFHRDFFATEMDWQRFRQFVNQRVIEPK
jgi:hypothetical protein